MVEYLDRSQITLENIDRKLEFENDFENSIGGIHRSILYTSPEVLFMSFICNRETDKAVRLFEDTKLFNGEKSAIDAPMDWRTSGSLPRDGWTSCWRNMPGSRRLFRREAADVP